MTKFSELKLDPKVLLAIEEAGYTSPTPIQEKAIPPALEGKDVLGIAQTGTGKTASFTLPMLTRLRRGRARARMPRSLVLAPTRELAAQVAENFDLYAKHTKLTRALLIGGVAFGEQDKLIDKGVDVLIATPGRLLDHFERGKLILTDVKVMVVDEADRMLDMGFIPDIERIFQLTPFTRQTLFFSATMAPEIERITNTFLQAPVRVEVARQATTSQTITQKLIEITPPRKDQAAKTKRELLRAVITAEGEKLDNGIVFCNRKTDVDIVSKSLQKYGFDAQPIHGDLDQSQRTRTLESFRDGKLKILVASDVAARGLDVPSVSHVFNYDLPMHAEDYVHRIGRTGRAGRLGTAISLATPYDEKFLGQIEDLVKTTLPRAEIPEGFELSDAASQAPRPRTERGGRSSSSRSERGGRNGRDHKRPVPDHGQEASKEPLNVAVPEAKSVEAKTAERRYDDRRDSERREEAPRAEAETPRSPRHDHGKSYEHGRAQPERHGSDRYRRNRRDDGPDVVGMGDHVPEFLLREFVISRPKDDEHDEDSVVETTAEVTVEAAAPAAPVEAKADIQAEAQTQVQEEAEAPKPTRSRRRKAAPKKAEETSAEAAVEASTDAAAPVATPEADVASEAVPAEPVAAEPAGETAASAEAAAEEPAAKPKRTRTRSTTAKPKTPKAKTTTTKAAAKPKATTTRSRKKKTDEPVEAAGDATAAPAAETPSESSES
ncbi:DEAD/DEAH box helicase [Thioclava sp. 'Guangxiensis']|uniref:DEAD/DEAH box helicase n=1 Tax=Thioclava sp. 'Guangxiensis' TaxID=3149044 RepID=UPI0038782F4A